MLNGHCEKEHIDDAALRDAFGTISILRVHCDHCGYIKPLSSEIRRVMAPKLAFRPPFLYNSLTFFSDTEGFRSSNGEISDDGNWIVFQGSISESDAGVGCGLYLYDLHHE